MANPVNIRPFRDFSDHDVNNLYALNTSTGVKGQFVKIAVGWTNDDQFSIKRLHRPGTTGVRLYSLVARDTIDAEIHSAISDRRDVIEGVLRRLRQNTPLPALQSKVHC